MLTLKSGGREMHEIITDVISSMGRLQDYRFPLSTLQAGMLREVENQSSLQKILYLLDACALIVSQNKALGFYIVKILLELPIDSLENKSAIQIFFESKDSDNPEDQEEYLSYCKDEDFSQIINLFKEINQH